MSDYGHRGHDDYPRDRDRTNSGSIPGVSYAEPFVPKYSAYPGYSSTGSGAGLPPQPNRAPPPTGGYQYSQLPHGVKYTSKKVIPVDRYDESLAQSSNSKWEDSDPYPTRRHDSDDEKRDKKHRSNSNYEEVGNYRSRSPGARDDWRSSKDRVDDGNPWRQRNSDSEDDRRHSSKKNDRYDDLGSDEDSRLSKNRGKKHDDHDEYGRDRARPYGSRDPNAPYSTSHDVFAAAGVPPPPPPPPPGHRDDHRDHGFEDSRRSSSHKESDKYGDTHRRDSRSPERKSSRNLSIATSSSLRAPSPGGLRAHSPGGLRPGMERLSVSGGGSSRLSVGGGESRHSSMSGGMPPPSPLLEAYRGTYQSMPRSPMPYAREYHDLDDEDLDDLEPLDGRDARASNASFELDGRKSGTVSLYRRESGRRRNNSSSPHRGSSRSPERRSKHKKSVSMYAADQDAREIAAQLLSRGPPDWKVVTDILPGLSHDQILELHTAYKRVAKLNGKGINIAKHIKLKATGNYRTIAYVTALGRWESESYWANSWYQSGNSKRELLIESLMGRTNHEIHMIKDSFHDKRYNDDLRRCMEKELRADKFGTAISMALDERRQEEADVYSRDAVHKDVDTWARAIRKGGGESALLDVCINRSDRHLLECLRVYEKEIGGNFAKDILDRSQNLVGEVIVHILNGVINRPARDAMLLHHALIDLKKDGKKRRDSSPSNSDARSSVSRLNPFSSESQASRESTREKAKEAQDRKERFELLISRVVRLHWDKQYMRRVKQEYRTKYRTDVEHDVEDYVKAGEFQEFCFGLLDTQHG